jgi:hypothetical protein
VTFHETCQKKSIILTFPDLFFHVIPDSFLKIKKIKKKAKVLKVYINEVSEYEIILLISLELKK